MSSLQNILENVDTSGIRENLFRIIIIELGIGKW